MTGHLALLRFIESFRLRNGGIGLHSIVAFLQVCENEGATIKELAYLCGISEASVSRLMQELQAPSEGTVAHDGLVRVYQHPCDGRRRVVYLTEDGCRLRDDINEILANGEPADGGSASGDAERNRAAADRTDVGPATHV